MMSDIAVVSATREAANGSQMPALISAERAFMAGGA